MFISALTRLPHTGQKFSTNIFLWRATAQLRFEISLFEQNFYQYVTIYLVWKRTYKNVDEKRILFQEAKTNTV